jgi:threonine/homoserine/homoserine lactone efflux protein
MEKALQLGAVFLGAYGIAFSGALMPGPLLAVTIREATRRGAWAGPLLMVGHAVLEGALVLILVLGFAKPLAHPAVTTVISLLGGATLLWMGAGMLRHVPAATDTAAESRGPAGSSHRLIGLGIVGSLSNPCWSLWWATTGLGYLVVALRLGVAGVVTFFAGHILADVTWYSFVSAGVSHARAFLAGPRYRVVIRVCGAGLVGFALWFLGAGAAAVARWLGTCR